MNWFIDIFNWSLNLDFSFKVSLRINTLLANADENVSENANHEITRLRHGTTFRCWYEIIRSKKMPAAIYLLNSCCLNIPIKILCKYYTLVITLRTNIIPWLSASKPILHPGYQTLGQYYILVISLLFNITPYQSPCCLILHSSNQHNRGCRLAVIIQRSNTLSIEYHEGIFAGKLFQR